MEKTILSLGLVAVISVGLMSMRPIPFGKAKTEVTAKQDPTGKAGLPPLQTATSTQTSPLPPVGTTDTLPRNNRRSDSLRKVKAERERATSVSDEQQAQAMKQQIEEQALKNQAMAEALAAKDEELARKKEMYRIKSTVDSAVHEEVSISGEGEGNQIQRIINDLKARGLVEDETNLTFSLDNEVLKVNDKVQPASVHQKFKDKYIHSPKDHFSYLRHGGSTMSTISVEK